MTVVTQKGPRPETNEELARKQESALNSIDSRRQQRKKEFRAEARERIAALYGEQADDPELVASQIRDVAQAVLLLWQVIDGAKTPDDIAPEIGALRSKFVVGVRGIRQAAVAGIAALDAAGTDTGMTVDARVAEIEAVTPVWPT